MNQGTNPTRDMDAICENPFEDVPAPATTDPGYPRLSFPQLQTLHAWAIPPVDVFRNRDDIR